MKKVIKTTLAVAAVAAAGMGSYRAYESLMFANLSEDDALLMENIEAMSSPSDNPNIDDVKYVKVLLESGSCYESVASDFADRKTENGINYIRYYYTKQLVKDGSVWEECITVPCLGGGCQDECVGFKCKTGYPEKDCMSGWGSWQLTCSGSLAPAWPGF